MVTNGPRNFQFSPCLMWYFEYTYENYSERKDKLRTEWDSLRSMCKMHYLHKTIS